ncbi:MAG: DUF5011 domain-containing protein [Lachnospiraceae bacterium]|nr:DUF5011 domain-containing protein [Lachnospiraceae bacterium]
MKKFRRIWFVLVTAATLCFGGYQVFKYIKEDSSGPVISCSQETIQVSIEDEESVLLKGVTAKDKKDGDVTDSILIEKLSGLYDGNKRTVTYAAFDSDNHISKTEREVIYEDYTSPRFGLSGSLRFRAGENVNIDQIVSAQDCIDGNISNKVKIVMDTTINNRVTGIYDIVYEVTNSAGDNAKLPVQVEIYDNNRNEVDINLSQYLVYYEGEAINYKSYLKSIKSGTIESYFEGVESADGQNGTISKNSVTVQSQVNENEPGVYPVYFYYENYGTIYTQGTEVMYVVVQ